MDKCMEAEEYFEIHSGHTSLSLIFQGVGESPKINISPNFLVFRLETKKKEIAQCSFEIKNKGEADITITIEKMFELQGLIKEIPKPEVSPNKSEKAKQDKKGKKDKKSDKKSKKGKSPRVQQFSNELTEAEKISLENYFTPKNDDIYFDIFSAEGNPVNIKPNGAKHLSICFGMPEILTKKKAEFMKKLTEKTKRKKGKGGKKSRGSISSKGSAKSKASKASKAGKKGTDNTTYYIAKYNFMMNKTFVKDVILICAFIGK